MNKKEKRRTAGHLLSRAAIVLLWVLVILMKILKILFRWIEMAFGVDIDISLPEQAEKVIMIVCIVVVAVSCVVLFILSMLQKGRRLKAEEQLEMEQSRRLVQQDSISGYLRKHGMEDSDIHKDYCPKRKISAEEQAESDQLEALNSESSTEWW